MDSGSTTFSSTPVAESRSRTSFFHRYYIFVKFHYFFYFAAFGIIYPILSITLRARGLSNAEISVVNAIIPFILFFTNPLVGFVVDSSRRYKLTFNVVLGLVIIIYGAMFMLPSIKSHNIQAHMSKNDQMGRVLNFCASQEVATTCASRSQCGCAYQANCSSVDQTKHLFFTFSMNSKTTHKDIRGSSNIGSSACGIEYEVPVDASLKDRQDSDLGKSKRWRSERNNEKFLFQMSFFTMTARRTFPAVKSLVPSLISAMVHAVPIKWTMWSSTRCCSSSAQI